jgi:hypothetical protein
MTYTLTWDARAGVGGYVERYHHRPHSGLNYRTPFEVREIREDGTTTENRDPDRDGHTGTVAHDPTVHCGSRKFRIPWVCPRVAAVTGLATPH